KPLLAIRQSCASRCVRTAARKSGCAAGEPAEDTSIPGPPASPTRSGIGALPRLWRCVLEGSRAGLKGRWRTGVRPPNPGVPIPSLAPQAPADTTTTDDPAAAPPGGGEPRGPGAEPSLAAAVRAVSGVTLLSRIGGLARDVILARLFGVTALNSAFLAAFAIPNMFRPLLGEGAVAAAVRPKYRE